jgi:V/A-type H+-transporting ATPase subunit I
MFAPERLQEVNLFVLVEDLEPVTEAIARLEVFHVQEVHLETWEVVGEWAEVAGRLGALERRLEQLLITLDFSPPDLQVENLQPRRDAEELEAELTLLEARMKTLLERVQQREREFSRLQAALPQIASLQPLGVPVETLRELRHVHMVTGMMPSGNVARVAEALFQIHFVLIPISRDAERTLVVAASSHQDAAVMDRAMKSAFFEPIELPLEARGQPVDALVTLEEHLAVLRQELVALESERQQLIEELEPELTELWQRLKADISLAEAMRLFTRHGEVYLIAGWVPAAKIEAFRETVNLAATDQVLIEVLPPDSARQDVPTLLKTPRWLRPFESLVAIFGLPSYHELNPTAFAAPAFLLMYGMMFGDMGHGALLALAGLSLWRRSQVFGPIVTAAGASGALFGLLYGIAFGKVLLSPLWLQPLHDIQTLLISAVLAGVALLNLGFVLNLCNAGRVKDWTRFWLDKNGVLGMALYWTLLGGGLMAVRGWLPPSVWLSILATLSLLLWWKEPLLARFKGGRAEPLGEVLVTGFFELFEALIGYASNSLSFVRLGAFAVAHEGLSRVVLVYSSGPSGWLVLLLGTVLIVGFEGLIVGIQTLRLEYYEFFGRFFQGTGHSFRPLSLKGGQDESLAV